MTALTILQLSSAANQTASPSAMSVNSMAMNVTPVAHPSNIQQTGRVDENAPDYSPTSGNGLAAPLQFVINNEPHLPRNREQKKLVRSHAKRQSRAVQKRKNALSVQKRAILQKGSPQRSAQPNFSITSANANVTSNRQTPFADSEVPVALSAGSDSDICLTPESSYLASEDGEARSFSTSPELDPPLPSLKSLQLDVHNFDRWMFDTSESVALPNAAISDISQPLHMLYYKMKEHPRCV